MRRLALACVVVACCGHAAAAALKVELGSISHPAFEVQELVFELADDAASASVSMRRLEAGGQRFDNVRFRCTEVRIALPRLACRDGDNRWYVTKSLVNPDDLETPRDRYP